MTEIKFAKACRAIRFVITDVDGVLTDGGMYYGETGEELKKFNVRDGVGVILLQAGGIKVGAMTGESTKLVDRRMKKIGMDFLFGGVKNKRACFAEFLRSESCESKQVAFIGDEINDCCLLGHVGVFFAASDACLEVRERANHVLATKGGDGVLREVASLVLSSQGKADEALEVFMRKSLESGT